MLYRSLCQYRTLVFLHQSSPEGKQGKCRVLVLYSLKTQLELFELTESKNKFHGRLCRIFSLHVKNKRKKERKGNGKHTILLEGPAIELDIGMVSVVYLYLPHFLPHISHLWHTCVGYLPCELKSYHIAKISLRSVGESFW